MKYINKIDKSWHQFEKWKIEKIKEVWRRKGKKSKYEKKETKLEKERNKIISRKRESGKEKRKIKAEK